MRTKVSHNIRKNTVEIKRTHYEEERLGNFNTEGRMSRRIQRVSSELMRELMRE